MLPYIDFHTHASCHQPDVLDIISWHPTQDKNPDFYTVGYHPWWIKNRLTDLELQTLNDKYVEDHKCLAIGECGLDKLKGIDLKTQEDVFVQHIILANQLAAPLVVHCVRQYDTLISLRKSEGKTPWVIHGFFRNNTLARQLLDVGCYMSLAPRHLMHHSFIETLKYVPLDRIFVETDSDRQLDIKVRYALFAQLRTQNIENLTDQMVSNVLQFVSPEKRATFINAIDMIENIG